MVEGFLLNGLMGSAFTLPPETNEQTEPESDIYAYIFIVFISHVY